MHLKQATRFDPPGLALPSCRGLPGVRHGSHSRSRRSTSLGGGLDFKWVCLKMLCSPKPNGFADHYPYYFIGLFHWEYTLFSDIPNDG